MDARQVYLWFCKEKGVLSNVMNMFRTKKPIQWDKSFLKHSDMQFSTYFECKHNIIGFRGLFCEMFNETYTHWYKKFGNTLEYVKAKKNWNYFINHNVKYNTNLKKGDVVTYEYWGSKKNGRLENIDILTNRVHLTDIVNGRRMIVKISAIESVNYTEPFIFEYYIEKKGKCYGIDKE